MILSVFVMLLSVFSWLSSLLYVVAILKFSFASPTALKDMGRAQFFLLSCCLMVAASLGFFKEAKERWFMPVKVMLYWQKLIDQSITSKRKEQYSYSPKAIYQSFCHFYLLYGCYTCYKQLQTISYLNMASEFDVTVAYLHDIYKQVSLDSQKLTSEIRRLREQLEQMQKNIETRTDNIIKEISPRIEQLEKKMSNSWGSIESMDKLAWDELEKEKEIFSQCQKIVQEMDSRIDEVS